MWGALGRAATTLGVGAAALALLAFAAAGVGVWHPGTEPASDAQPCLGGSDMVPSLFGNDLTTQIRLSSPDLKSQRVLRTEPANRLPGMFQSLLSVSRDGGRIGYITADDEQIDNARVTFIDVAHPDTPHVIASEPTGMLPIRPVWSPSGEQLAFVVARTQQGHLNYQVLAASTTGGPVLNIATLSPDAFASLNTNVLCVTPAGSVTVLPPPTPANGDSAGSLSTPITVVTPSPTSTTGLGGGTRCELPVLSQNDPRWKDHRMQPTGESVGQVGCAVTSAAMVLDYFSANLTPDQLADCLGGSAVPIYWSRAAACTRGQVSGAVASDFTWAGLDAILAAGRPAIVGMLGGTVGMHFVVVTSGGGDVADRYRIVDPWSGRAGGTLGGYTRSGSTLFQLVDFRAVGPGCGKLLTTTPDSALKIVDGVSDGGIYHRAVKLTHLVHDRKVTVERLSHDPRKGDDQQDLGAELTVTEDGNYRIIVTDKSGNTSSVLSFTIDNTAPIVGVTFPNQAGTVKGSGGTQEPVLSFPGSFQVFAGDELTRIVAIQATLNGAPVPDTGGVAGIANRKLTYAPGATGTFNLVYSATSASGISSGGQVTFLVQPPRPGSAGPASTGQSGGSGSGGHEAASSPTPTKVPPPPPGCRPLSSATLTDTLSGTTHVLSWNGNGTCGPFTGQITAKYGTYINIGCEPGVPCGAWIYSTATYPVTAVSGTYQDTRSAGRYIYTLTLTDALGNTTSASAL